MGIGRTLMIIDFNITTINIFALATRMVRLAIAAMIVTVDPFFLIAIAHSTLLATTVSWSDLLSGLRKAYLYDNSSIRRTNFLFVWIIAIVIVCLFLTTIDVGINLNLCRRICLRVCAYANAWLFLRACLHGLVLVHLPSCWLVVGLSVRFGNSLCWKVVSLLFFRHASD